MIAETKLTSRQQEVLDWMRGHPGFSYREAMDDLGLRSTNGVKRYVDIFEAMRLIEKRPGARGVRVVDGDPVSELLDAARSVLAVWDADGRLETEAREKMERALEPFGGANP